ncbi:hypothetical protein Glove_11g35 [Diversispora epigaea]|uniref:Protein kinase domain-containing protein n=1 Tax=Diversispora epigaea TaxID=1348612 RepID=A0A397JZ38_9GLOM|nr:hypothetical protein Glove_11g35 [Diversispora epigaea]
MTKKNNKIFQGYCKNCHHPNTSFDWCQPCNSQRFRNNFYKWTSGNINVDNIIMKMQTGAKNSREILEWIPWLKFKNVSLIDSGGLGSVYSANWIDGCIAYWNEEKKDWGRYESGSTFVIKIFDDSKNMTASFLNEVFAIHQSNISGLIRYYGFTKEPNSDNYGIVSEYAGKNLHQHIAAAVESSNKLEILIDISLTLNKLHSSGLIHKNIHTRNILKKQNSTFIISDFGLCFQANKELGSREYFGVLEYSAPEILLGSQHTKESDIYSFGILMLEVFAGVIKLPNITPDFLLAKEICYSDIRPEISSKLPTPIVNLIKRCWDKFPKNRPTSHEISELLSEWWMKILNMNDHTLTKLFQHFPILNIKDNLNNLNTTLLSQKFNSKRLDYCYYLDKIIDQDYMAVDDFEEDHPPSFMMLEGIEF